MEGPVGNDKPLWWSVVTV